MRGALVLGMLVSLVVAAGCGDDGGDRLGPAPEGEPASTTTSPSTTDPSDLVAPVEVEVSFPEPLVSGGPTTWTVTITNTAAEAVRIVFPTGQRGEVTLSRDGEEVYRWSASRAFTQALGEEVLEPGGKATYTLDEPSFDVEPGIYQLAATTTGRPAAPMVERTVEVEAG